VQTRGEVSIPAPHPTQFGVGTAAEERRTHHPDDFSQLVLAAQAALNLGHEVVRQPQGIKGLLEGLGGVLCLATVARETLLRGAITTSSGFGVLFGISCIRSYAVVESRIKTGIESPWGGKTLCLSHSGYTSWRCCILPD
jgi:hypothetical protein